MGGARRPSPPRRSGALKVAGLPGVVAAKIAKQLVGGGKGLAHQVVQRTLDVGRANAQRRLDDLAEKYGGIMGDVDSGFPGIDTSGRPGIAANRRLGKQMAARYGWGSGPQWAALDHLWGVDESGWDEGVLNFEGSGAYGIAQALPSSKYPPAGRPEAPGGLTKAKAQIAWGLNYIKTRPGYGTPIAADAFRHANGWYGQGGIIEAAGGTAFGGGGKGGARGEPGLAAGLPKALRQTLKRATGGKQSKRALQAFKKKVGKLDLPKGLQGQITDLIGKHERADEFATRAQGLSTTNDTTGVAQLAKIGDKNEGGWLVEDLSVLTKLRNRLLELARSSFGARRRSRLR